MAPIKDGDDHNLIFALVSLRLRAITRIAPTRSRPLSTVGANLVFALVGLRHAQNRLSSSPLYDGDLLFRQAIEAVDELIDEPVCSNQFLLDRQQQCQAFFVLLPHPLFEGGIERAPQAAGVLPQHLSQGLEGRVLLALLVVTQIVLERCLSGQGFDTIVAVFVGMDPQFLFQPAKKPL